MMKKTFITYITFWLNLVCKICMVAFNKKHKFYKKKYYCASVPMPANGGPYSTDLWKVNKILLFNHKFNFVIDLSVIVSISPKHNINLLFWSVVKTLVNHSGNYNSFKRDLFINSLYLLKKNVWKSHSISATMFNYTGG